MSTLIKPEPKPPKPPTTASLLTAFSDPERANNELKVVKLLDEHAKEAQNNLTEQLESVSEAVSLPASMPELQSISAQDSGKTVSISAQGKIFSQPIETQPHPFERLPQDTTGWIWNDDGEFWEADETFETPEQIPRLQTGDEVWVPRFETPSGRIREYEVPNRGEEENLSLTNSAEMEPIKSYPLFRSETEALTGIEGVSDSSSEFRSANSWATSLDEQSAENESQDLEDVSMVFSDSEISNDTPHSLVNSTVSSSLFNDQNDAGMEFDLGLSDIVGDLDGDQSNDEIARSPEAYAALFGASSYQIIASGIKYLHRKGLWLLAAYPLKT